MRRAIILVFAAMAFAAFGPAVFAQTCSGGGPVTVANSCLDLYDFALNTSNGMSGDWQDISTTDPTTLINPSSSIYNDANCCGDASGGTTKGLGNVKFRFNGSGAGNYTVSLYFDYDASIPDFNEYGTINNIGSAQSGITGEIFNANEAGNDIVLFGATGTAGDETYGLADDANEVPGTTSNFNANCFQNFSEAVSNAVGALSCNGDPGMALTYSFTLAANQYAVINAAMTTTAPAGFSLETTHPTDPDNNLASNVYITGTYSINNTVSSSTPEPSTWILMGAAMVLLGMYGVRRKAGIDRG